MKYYYVDYENVHEDGLKGIDQLGADCHVFLYWHKHKCSSPPKGREVSVKITHSCIDDSSKDAVDKVIIKDFRKQIQVNKASECFIVSNDTGFDKLPNIKRIASIAESLRVSQSKTMPKQNQTARISCANHSKVSNKEKKRQQIQMLFNNKLIMYIMTRDMICNIVLNSKTKAQVRSELQKNFDNKRAKYIYQTIKEFIQDLPEK